MSEKKRIYLLTLLLSFQLLVGCVVLPTDDHWAGKLENGEVEAFEQPCGGRRHWNPIPGGSVNIERDEKNGVLLWTITRKVSRSVQVESTPVVFTFKDRKVSSTGSYRLRFMKPHPQDIYRWQDGYRITWNKNGTQAVITQFEKKKSFLGGDREKVVKTFTYEYPTAFKDIHPEKLYEVQPFEGMDEIYLIHQGSQALIKQTFEIEIPTVKIDGKDYAPVKTWFKYINKWVVSPFNC